MDDLLKLDPSKGYTYADYLTWRFEERVELIKGKIFKMSPAPKRVHQEISLNITLQIGNYLKGKTCKLYEAPFDVRFLPENGASDDQITTVVQPDLCVICDPAKLDDAGCLGAPDLIIEILSPSSSKKDAQNKYELYQEFGVKEYWLVHTTDQLVDVFDLKENEFKLRKIYANPDSIESSAVDGLLVDLEDVFENLS
ncbi:MAG: Uma2 family endonuclease [Bacteroidota bacterium]